MLILLFVILEIAILLVVILIRSIRNVLEDDRRHKAEANAIAAFKGKPAEFLETAKRMDSLKEPKMALSAVRNSLEALIKIMADEVGLRFDPETTLFGMIEALDEGGWLHKSQVDLMHQIRIRCNRGSHVELNEMDIGSNEGYEAIQLMEQLIFDIGQYQGKYMPDVFTDIAAFAAVGNK